MRVLFKPSLAVQARELTQLQTILNKQLDLFSSHVFKEGSLVYGGAWNIDNQYYYVQVRDNDYLANNVNVVNFTNTSITGLSSNLTAIVVNTADGNESSSNTKTLFVKYNKGASNTFFTPGERLVANNGVSANVISSNTAVGTGFAFSIEEGVLFAKDHYVPFDKQTIVVDRYNVNTANAHVGFNLTEEIVTVNDDTTLNSLAQGTPNESAPGADRLKLTASLTKYDLGANTGTDFVELLQINQGVIEERYEKPQYSIIKDELARRTYDESGDYFISGLSVNVRDHLKTDENNGYLTLAQGGNADLIAVGIEPGKAYIRGYDFENLITRYIELRKGINSVDLEEQVVSANYGNYVVVDEVAGAWNVNDGDTVTIYDTAQNAVSTRNYSTSSPSGNVIGTAKVKTIERVSGNHGEPSTTYNLYLFDVQMSNAAFCDSRSFYIDNAFGSDGFADSVVTANSACLNEVSFNKAIFPLSASYVRRIRNSSGNVDTSYEFYRRYNVSIGTGGTFTINTGSANEIFPYSVGALNDTQKNQFYIVLDNTAEVTLTGNVSITSGSNNVTGTGTAFSTQLQAGDIIEQGSNTFIIASISTDTSLNLTTAAGSTQSGAFRRQDLFGKVLDFTRNGANGTERSITVASTTSATFNMQENLTSAVDATVLCRLQKTDAQETGKSYRSRRLVKIDFSSHSANNTGPWSLGFSDIFRINSIRKNSTAFTTGNEGSNVTTDFILDNGQRDTLYALGSIRKNPSSTLSLGSSEHLLIDLDYFDPDFSQGSGYFSVDSYPIDDVFTSNTQAIQTYEIPRYRSNRSGALFDLRNVIDARPVLENTATDTTAIGSASTNPSANSLVFQSGTGGLRTPVVNENYTLDLSYYLPRKDVIYMDRFGNFGVSTGVSALITRTPKSPENAMSLATVTIPPYPSLSPQFAKTLGRIDEAVKINKTAFRRYTMRDIGVLEQRIENLEYYVTLTLLEKEAFDLKITDANGLDRFKNGVLVDAFTGHTIGDRTNPDYLCAIDQVKSELRPRFEISEARFIQASSGSSNIRFSNNIVTLDYNETSYIEQPFGTNTRNAAGLFYKYVGELFLDPPHDYWTDTTESPARIATLDTGADNWIELSRAWGTQWGNWGTTWTRSNSETTSDRRDGGTEFTTTTTTQTGQVRTGTQLEVSTFEQQTDLGTNVTNVSLNPFIRPQSIRVEAIGLKPNTTVNLFFDGDNLTSQCTPANSSFGETGTQGSALTSDDNGNLYCIFAIPSGYTSGTKKIRLIDNTTEAGSITTAAETSWTAQGVNQQTQQTILSTEVATLSTRTLSETRTVTSSSSQSRFEADPQNDVSSPREDEGQEEEISWWERRRRETNNWADTVDDPVGQSFYIETPANAGGVFVTSIDLYFSTKDPNLGVFVDIRELDANGQLSPFVVPYSKVHVPTGNINVNPTSPTTVTNIKFKAPIFLQKGFEYAVTVVPVGNNPNTNLWTSILGEIDIITGQRVTKQPYSGALFASSNDRTWTPIQDEDLKFRLNRASFSPLSGTLAINNENKEWIRIGNVSSSFASSIGEVIRGEHDITLVSISGGTPNTGWTAIGGTSSANGVVTELSASVIGLRDVPARSNFQIGETISFNYANGSSTGVTATANVISVPSANLVLYEAINSNTIDMVLKQSSGNFNQDEYIVGQTSNNTARILQIRDIPYNTVDPEISSILPAGTDLTMTLRKTANNALESTFASIDINDPTDISSEVEILSKSRENEVLSSAKSVQGVLTLTSPNSYLSPVVDISQSYSLFIYNDINNLTTGEDGISGGNAKFRYQTPPVELADGQEAEDLKVYLTSYRPFGTDIKVYAKILHGEDDASIEDGISWFELTLESRNVFGELSNSEDFIEYTYTIPTSMLTGPNSSVQYTNPNGVTFTTYKYFMIKIVGISPNTSLIPRVKDMRIICLQQ